MFFFFKHKKAYELRIRDWSSDVCSSDLGGWATINGSDYAKVLGGGIIAFDATDYTDKDDASSWLDGEIISDSENAPDTPFRSEERRVGKECARTVRSRWSPEH